VAKTSPLGNLSHAEAGHFRGKLTSIFTLTDSFSMEVYRLKVTLLSLSPNHQSHMRYISKDVAMVMCDLISSVAMVMCDLISSVAMVMCDLISSVVMVMCDLISSVAMVMCHLISSVAMVTCDLISSVPKDFLFFLAARNRRNSRIAIFAKNST
jgi:phage-related protein